jgi:hypothetical protein
MAVRKPLKIIGGNIMPGTPEAPEYQELHRNEYTAMIDETIRQFGLLPGSTLYATTGTVSTSAGGSIGTLTDTRKKAGAAGSDSTNFDTSSETQDVQTETTNFVRVYADSHNDLISDGSAHFPVTAAIQAAAPEKLKGSGYSGASGYSYPLYRSGSGASATLQPMNRQDMLDTFWLPAVKRMMIADTSNSDAAGTFITTTTTTLSNHTSANTTGSALAAPSSSLAIFSNTKADVSAFASGDLPETLDQTTGTTNYYLQRRNASSTQGQMAAIVGLTLPFFGVMRAIPHSVLGLQLREIARYGSTFGNSASASGPNKGRIRYRFMNGADPFNQIPALIANDDDGNPLGVVRSSILDTAFNSSTYRTQLVSDDYRSQEVPAGSEATVKEFKLIIHRE